MRPTVPALLAVLATAGIAAAAPGANAAEGALFAAGLSYENPAGCLDVGDGSDVEIRNRTDGVVHLYDVPGCSGDVVEVLAPNDAAYFAVLSVRVED
ncbi:hypothetical protein [Nocardia arthritidis]|uniref:hypothetical protein n=1 Tax=Nocardia arthritidis TaxID=228602 RepID=UPI0007A3CAA0|nr:hypothetical protein [Nocardia arthritidis]